MGKGIALRSLFFEARESNADVFVTVDGDEDGQHSHYVNDLDDYAVFVDYVDESLEARLL